MLKYSLLALVVLFMQLPVICDSKDFAHAIAQRGCTQEDAPALEIYLTSSRYDGAGVPAGRYIHIEVAGRDWQDLLNRDLALLPLSRVGSDRMKPLVRAERVMPEQRQGGDGEKRKSAWLRGTLKLSKVVADKEVEGSYNFTGGDGRLKGNFKASWRKGRGGCG
ncbi:MAG: hypothetical protein ABI967_06310 [bacterium]